MTTYHKKAEKKKRNEKILRLMYLQSRTDKGCIDTSKQEKGRLGKRGNKKCNLSKTIK